MAHTHIIEFGWDTPSTASAATAVDVSHAPFDGVVLDPTLVLPDGSERLLSRSVLVNESLTDATLEQDSRTSGLADAFHAFPSNLLRMNASPLPLAWDGDFSTVLENLETLGRAVATHHLAGIVFDTEQYNNATIWDPAQGGTPELARARGADFGRHYGNAAPGSIVLFTMAHTYVGLQQGAGNHTYDLLAPFVDGMMEGAPDSIIFVDGYEISYGFRYRQGAWFPDSFTDARQIIRNARSLSLVPTVYDQRMTVGFGIWGTDYADQWSSTDFGANHFTPDELQTSVTSARDASDGWVWVYTQRVSWYVTSDVLNSDGSTQFYAAPEAYRGAVSAARQ
jgi:hypothetical protein